MASEIGKESEAMVVHQMYQNPWKIKKILIEPDIALDRMFKFTKTETEHIFGNMTSDKVEKAKQGEDVRVKMVDLDTELTEFELSFRKVRNGQVFGFKRGWVTHFVVRRRLKVGEEIGIFVDQTSSKFYFSVLSRANVYN
ncbi:B3 domain-containing protein At5g26805 [Ziziphus jujuba]|uniref:B3 domain-containing protein At5g26805 n=2 Tax=Ziziphus jujuba TaxID=326968 RepID=A0A6P3ZLE8_ZIZJJ|nr:B3 domain-containing protein At5g26805 [Ziziphus jujuba]KAH7533442.1 hypothetical protein FEM48_Zijuj04G0131000 [Ziziphus jujuba var. spinosa]